jgi:hypothetical protein
MACRKINLKGKKKKIKRMNSDDWRQYRFEQKQRRQKRLPIRQKEIENLCVFGYSVAKKTNYQYRVENIIDLYPIHRQYHILESGKRGSYNVGLLYGCLLRLKIRPSF